MLYADVCVNTPTGRQITQRPPSNEAFDPLGQIFTYTVPERLDQRLQPGHLVWVPFRSRRVQAVVLAVHDTVPTFETREVEALIWSQPVLTPAQLALAQWISTYYLAPLIEALRLMLPAGISRRGRTVLVRTGKPAPTYLPPRQAAVLARIAAGEGTWAEVSEGLGKVTQRAQLEPLIAQGLVAREVAFPTPPPRPKTDRLVRLLADGETQQRLLPQLGRRSKAADALQWMFEQEDPMPTVAALCAAAGCGDAHLRALVERGWIELQPGQASIRRLPLASTAESPLPALTPRQEEVLAALALEPADEAKFCAAHGTVEKTLRALAGKGLVERCERPARIRLLINRKDRLAALAELRGTQRHLAVLEALQRRQEPAWIGWVYAETGANLKVLRDLEAAGLIAIDEEMVWRDPLAGREFAGDQQPVLTLDQKAAWETVSASLDGQGKPGGQSPVYLLFGVTGSGKTEIYLRSIAEILRQGKQAVILVPEIALTPQTIRRFAARFPCQVTVWHSQLGEGERFDIWRRVRTGHPAAQVVVGSRSALFLPFPDLGLIVVDEEHEATYKALPTPRYHARTTAMALGRILGAPVILGSATPALETYYAATRGAVRLLVLPQRVMGHGQPLDGPTPAGERQGSPSGNGHGTSAIMLDLPDAQIVDMRQELRVGNRSMFSRSLRQRMAQVLADGQQAILYLNRRGSATFVLCRDCGHVEVCPRCAVPLAYHAATEALICHHCNRRYPVPFVCPDCRSKRIRYFGSGTQHIEEAVQLTFPSARVLRWDRDVTGAKGAHEAILSRFVAHEADVLVGTQMIAKGLDLPLVTLVGVIAADVGLFLPDFRANERTFQLLTQVAGRAGRSALGGHVIIQTYHPEHYAILAASHHDYESFYRQEMIFRREHGYPPIRRLARLTFYGSQEGKAQDEAAQMAEHLRAEIASLGLPDTDIIGPAPCFFTQQRGLFRWQVILRSPDPTVLLRKMPLPLGWRLDVDPMDLL